MRHFADRLTLERTFCGLELTQRFSPKKGEGNALLYPRYSGPAYLKTDYVINKISWGRSVFNFVHHQFLRIRRNLRQICLATVRIKPMRYAVRSVRHFKIMFSFFEYPLVHTTKIQRNQKWTTQQLVVYLDGRKLTPSSNVSSTWACGDFRCGNVSCGASNTALSLSSKYISCRPLMYIKYLELSKVFPGVGHDKK